MQTCVSIPLQVGIFVSNTPAWEMERSRLSITEILCLNIILMVVFSFVASLMADWAKSKPLIGFGGLFSAALATMSGFGFCCYVGVEFISLVRITCYSALGTILKSLLNKCCWSKGDCVKLVLSVTMNLSKKIPKIPENYVHVSHLSVDTRYYISITRLNSIILCQEWFHSWIQVNSSLWGNVAVQQLFLSLPLAHASHKGPCTYYVCLHFGILDPSPMSVPNPRNLPSFGQNLAIAGLILNNSVIALVLYYQNQICVTSYEEWWWYMI